MGIQSTNKIIDPRKSYKIALYRAVDMYERRKRAKSHRGIMAMMKSSAICSQCKKGMRNDIAKAQVENKRENAPICIACIMGIARRPVGFSNKPKWQKKTLNALDTMNGKKREYMDKKKSEDDAVKNTFNCAPYYDEDSVV